MDIKHLQYLFRLVHVAFRSYTTSSCFRHSSRNVAGTNTNTHRRTGTQTTNRQTNKHTQRDNRLVVHHPNQPGQNPSNREGANVPGQNSPLLPPQSGEGKWGSSQRVKTERTCLGAESVPLVKPWHVRLSLHRNLVKDTAGSP